MLRSHLVQALVGLSTCEKHGEKEKLFCEDDHRILCHSCSLAPEHKDHHILPLEEVAATGKEKLLETQKCLKRKEERLQEKLDHLVRAEVNCKTYFFDYQHILFSEYEILEWFVEEEKDLQFNLLREQFINNMVKYDRRKVKLSQELQSVQSLLLDVEMHVEETPSEMVQGMKGTLDKSEKLLLHEEPEPEAVSEDWRTYVVTGRTQMLMTFFRDITLDPDTAHIHLVVSKDLKSVKYTSVPQDQSNNKDRFVHSLTVLGAQTFTSGRHYWEVEVGENTQWEVGICEESISRKCLRPPSPEEVRTISGCKRQDGFYLCSSRDGYHQRPPIPKVGIFLHYEWGHLGFYNAMDRTLLFHFPKKDFQKPMRPFFSLCVPDKESPTRSLIICPRSDQ
ncbi:putative E3 ubiquitin-protein ligase TRIML1 [Sminthopsis crassicaudata]|uniref:putative E3 ubiquitin-protein ligase TRIML1 n=1 Tax=Sminthopsis crassicaudata TaxID=9301 RepID=UPI003D69BCD0